MEKKQQEEIQGTEKEFLNIFQKLCYGRSEWQVWEVVIAIIALTIANTTEWNEQKRKEREEKYCDCVKRIGGEKNVQFVSKLMAIIVIALENNPEQDFLGEMYMNLGLSSHWKGQFFTPYHVCKAMANMNAGESIQKEIKEKGYISVCDPCCGAGALLIAYANALRQKEINFQQTVLFVGQDIDTIAGMMCYIQLSLLGCAGYIVIANTLTNPVCGDVLNPIEKEGQEFWYMPMFRIEQWRIRVLLHTVRQYSVKEKSKNIIKQSSADMTVTATEKQIPLEKKKQNKKDEIMTGQIDLFSIIEQ